MRVDKPEEGDRVSYRWWDDVEREATVIWVGSIQFSVERDNGDHHMIHFDAPWKIIDEDKE